MLTVKVASPPPDALRHYRRDVDRIPDERRVVSLLFADVVGSSALAERLDPEEVRLVIGEAIGRAVRIVESYGGTIKDLAGDGLLGSTAAMPLFATSVPTGPRSLAVVVRSVRRCTAAPAFAHSDACAGARSETLSSAAPTSARPRRYRSLVNGRGPRRDVLDGARRRYEWLTAAVVRCRRAMTSADTAESATARVSLLDMAREIDYAGRW